MNSQPTETPGMSSDIVLQARQLGRCYEQGDLSVDVLRNVTMDIAKAEGSDNRQLRQW